MAFLMVDYDYLRNPEYLAFAMRPSHLTWSFLRMRIYRPKAGRAPHPDRIGFYDYGWLCAHCTVEELVADWKGMRSRTSVREDLAQLEQMRLIEQVLQPGFTPFYILGTWNEYEHRTAGRQRQRIEVLFADRLFLPQDGEEFA